MTGRRTDETRTQTTGATESVVLVVSDETARAETYAEWLSEQHTVEIAGGDDALPTITGRTDIVLLDRELAENSGEDVLARLGTMAADCSVALVTATPPDFDIVHLDVDEYLTTPLTRAEVTDLVAGLAARRRFDERITELFSLVSKRAALMETKSAAELTRSDAYRELVRQIQAVNTELDGIVHGLSARDTDALFAQLNGSGTGCVR